MERRVGSTSARATANSKRPAGLVRLPFRSFSSPPFVLFIPFLFFFLFILILLLFIYLLFLLFIIEYLFIYLFLAEGGVERTRGELDAALRRYKQLAKALRECEARREETRNALVARDAALKAAEARLEDMLQRTVDALVLIHERDEKRKPRQQPQPVKESEATNTNTNPNTTTPVEEKVELIMKTIVGPLLDGVGTTATKTNASARKTAAVQPVKVKRSRPARSKQQQQQQVAEPVAS